MKFVWLLLNVILLGSLASAQEINFSRVQDMTIWYNQSLKTDKSNSIKLNFRNVQYAGAVAYNSIAAMADLPILSAAQKEKERSGYLSASVGVASDKSNQGILNNTLGLAGVSYAIPVAANEVYVAVGFQAAYYQSRLNVTDITAFGDQYDKYGPIEGMQSSDRLANGWSYNHINLNAGISVFSNSEFNKWYLGASVMSINKPYTDKLKTDDYRLKQALGIQGGYRFIAANNDDCAFHTSLNWQGRAYKHFFNMSYFKAIKKIEGGGGIGLGMGYRYDDALVPNLEIRYVKAIIGLSYDINISGINAAGLQRNGLELAVKLDF
ncbi:MAG: hypothetical protein H7Y03_07250 [Chitinophagaceae bacterium]|nr:hypothetical protein [Chitinophagaceae bacterium]